MKRTDYAVLVVGAGMAGLCAAKAAAAKGAASVLLINGEDRLPYKRTKVSKNLTAPYDTDAFALATVEELAAAGIELCCTSVTGLDVAARTVALKGGETIRWRSAVLATGATPVHRFPGRSHVVRLAADGDALLAAATGAARAVIVGGGVLGVEVADQLCQRGLDTTIISRAPHLMVRDLSEQPSRWLKGICERAGVTCGLGTTVLDVVDDPDGGVKIVTGDRCLQADLVVECAGTIPQTELARAAGLKVGQGIHVDWNLQTTGPHVFAAGDCIELPDGTVPHLWHHAEEQGTAAGQNAARAAAGCAPEPFPNRPRRLKCEAFGEFIFSMNPQLRDRLDETLVFQDGDIFQTFGFIDGALQMVIMTGDGDRAKLYEQAVWKGLSPEDVRTTFRTH